MGNPLDLLKQYAIGKTPNLDYSNVVGQVPTTAAPTLPQELPLEPNRYADLVRNMQPIDSQAVDPMKKFQDLLGQMPTQANTHHGILNRISAIGAGIGGGPEEAQKVLQMPYDRAYQDWARQVSGQELGLELPPTIKALQNKPLLDQYKLLGEQAHAKEENTLADLHQKQVDNYQPPLTFDQRKELKEDVPEHAVKQSELDETTDLVLQEQKIDPKSASPTQRLKAQGEAFKRLHPITPAQNIGEGIAKENQLLREQDRASANIDKVETPISQDAARISRLDDLLSGGSQATDPTIAPELLQVVTQGKGRMSEAEIKRIIGGPDKQQQFWNFLGSLKSDPDGRYQMPQVTQDQIKQMIKVMRARNDKKVDAINDARKELEGTTNPMKVLSVTSKLKKSLEGIDSQEIKPTIAKVFSWSKYHAAHPEVSRTDFDSKVMAVGGKAVD